MASSSDGKVVSWLIWRAINELANKGMPCDAVTLGDWFESNGLAEMVGGAGYLIELANSTPSAANIAAYAEIVRERSVMRNLAAIGTQIADSAYSPHGKDASFVQECFACHSPAKGQDYVFTRPAAMP